MTNKNIEIGVVGINKVFKTLSEAEIKDYLDEVE